MNDSSDKRTSDLTVRRRFLVAAATLQVGCAFGFVADIVVEWQGPSLHGLFEILGVVALLIGAMLAIRGYRTLLNDSRRIAHRNTRVEQQLRAATGAFQEVIEQHFDAWKLTEAERDVALLSIKGVPIPEMAAMRSTREGTIKAQNGAIYRKAGVSGRAELISVVVEELISGLEIDRQAK